MKITEAPKSLVFESRALTNRTWLIWGLLFLPGLALLLLLPQTARFIGLIAWMAIWLASIFVLPRWAGDLVQVRLDGTARRILFERNGQVTRELAFGDLKKLEMHRITTAARPYRAFRLVAVLRDATQVTLAVDSNEGVIQRCLTLARQYSR